jgi:hypothetical protein
MCETNAEQPAPHKRASPGVHPSAKSPLRVAALLEVRGAAPAEEGPPPVVDQNAVKAAVHAGTAAVVACRQFVNLGKHTAVGDDSDPTTLAHIDTVKS